MSLPQTVSSCIVSAVLLAVPVESTGKTKTHKIQMQTTLNASNIFSKPGVPVLPINDCQDHTIRVNVPIGKELSYYIARGRELLNSEGEGLRAGKKGRIIGAVLHREKGEIRIFALERPLYESHRKFPFTVSGAVNTSCIYKLYPHDFNGIGTNVDIYHQDPEGERGVIFLGWSFVGLEGKTIINTPGTSSIVSEHMTEEHIGLIDTLFADAMSGSEGESIRTLIQNPGGYTGTFSRAGKDKKGIQSKVKHQFPFPGGEVGMHRLIHGISLVENIDASPYEELERTSSDIRTFIRDQISRVSAIWGANKLASFTGRLSSAKAKGPFQITPGAWNMLRQYYPHIITLPFETGIQDPVMSMRAQMVHLILEWTRIYEDPDLKTYFEAEGAEEYRDAILLSGYNMSVDRLRGFLKEIISKNPTIAYESLISELDAITTKRLPSGKESQYYRLKGRVVRRWLEENLEKYYQKNDERVRKAKGERKLEELFKTLILLKQ